MESTKWRIVNPNGSKRVIVTRELPGERWLDILKAADCSVEIRVLPDVPDTGELREKIGDRCDGAIGQLTETWGEELFSALKSAGGKAYGNYAVGYDNVDLHAATRHGIPVGNTPGVLTETTAEMAVALTFAAARRVGEAERFVRDGRFAGWLPTMFLGRLLWRKTLGVIGAGRIGSAYAEMMVEGHKMDLVYFNRRPNEKLESRIAAYSKFLQSCGEKPVSCRRASSIDEVLETSDCVSLHTVLDDTTRHMIDSRRLSLMRPNAVLVNTSRGPVIDEAALVEHCKSHPEFRAGLDVFENEPSLQPGLVELENVTAVPHIGSATNWTRSAMADLAASNVAAILQNRPVWGGSDIAPFLSDNPPDAAPSILNARELGLDFSSTETRKPQ